MLPSSLLFLFLGISNAANAIWSGQHCFDGCDLTLNYVDFNDTDSGLSKKIRTCRSRLHAKSLFLCLNVYCEEDGREGWLNGVNETCNGVLPPWNVVDAYAPEDVENMRKLRADEGMWNSNTPPLGEVVLPDEAFVDRAVKTLDYVYGEVDIRWAYSYAMYYFWAIVVSIGICWRLAQLIQGLRNQEWEPLSNNDVDIEGHGSSKSQHTFGLPYTLLKRYIIIPATFGYRCSQNIGWCTIPPRIQSLTILSFVAINILFCCINYRVFSGNLYWPLISTQLWRYVSDRTGVISLANFPLIWLFGTRNNILIWVTGWGFGTYNNFHRWVARVATVQAVVHSIGYTEMVFERGGWSLFMKYWGKHYFWNGEVATILMCAICAFSVYGLRRCHYEIFLVTHIVLSIIVLLTTFYHVEIFNGEYNIFIWPCALLWALDRIVRVIRILAFNPKFWNTQATATYDVDSNLVRLEIPCDKNLLKAQPGTYYYINVLNNVLFAHQNHPFTLAYTSSNTTRSTRLHSYSTSGSSTTSSESDSLLPIPSHTSTSSLVFLIRPYSGFTSRLRDTCSLYPRTLRVLVEGPYGAPTTPLHAFAHIVFIAGGTGIAVAIAYLSALSTLPTSSATHIHIVWAVREHALVTEILTRDIGAEILKDERIKITVHVTQDEEDMKDDIVLDEDMGTENVVLKSGRPDVETAVEEAAREAEGRKLAVVACGPAGMADEARRACVRVLERWRGVEYFEESFKW